MNDTLGDLNNYLRTQIMVKSKGQKKGKARRWMKKDSGKYVVIKEYSIDQREHIRPLEVYGMLADENQ